MEHLVIRNKDETFIRVECSEGVAWELRDAFSFRPPGFQFVPSYKQKLWDGWLRLFDTSKRQIYRGLAPQVMEWATKKGYTYDLIRNMPPVSIRSTPLSMRFAVNGELSFHLLVLVSLYYYISLACIYLNKERGDY